MNSLYKHIASILHFIYLHPSMIFLFSLAVSFFFNTFYLVDLAKQYEHFVNADTPFFYYFVAGSFLAHSLLATLILYLFLSFIVDVLFTVFFKNFILCNNCKDLAHD